MLRHILFMLLVFCLCSLTTDLMAPETTERDIFGYESYHVEENGAICDKNGTIKGWITDNTVYDADWNIRYYIQGGRHYKEKEDLKM